MQNFSDILARWSKFQHNFEGIVEAMKTLPTDVHEFFVATDRLRTDIDVQISECQLMQSQLPALNRAQQMLTIHPEGQNAWLQYQLIYFSIHAFEDYLHIHRFFLSAEQYAEAPPTLQKYLDSDIIASLNQQLTSLAAQRMRMERIKQICRYDWIGLILAFGIMSTALLISLPWVALCIGALTGLVFSYGSAWLRERFQVKYHRALQHTLSEIQTPVLMAFKTIRKTMPKLDAQGKIHFPQI